MLDGAVAQETFGYDRHLNQMFYRSKEWKSIRRQMVLRDNGCDMGLEDYPIPGHVYVHHMNPITKDDILQRSAYLLDPEYLITVSYNTHQMITFGTETLMPEKPVTRELDDTCP